MSGAWKGFAARLRPTGLASASAARGRIRPWLGLCWLLLLLQLWPAWAHNPDTSYARVKVTGQGLEFRFTYDLFTLLRVAPLDANGDKKISRTELLAQAEAIHQFLQQYIAFEVNAQPTDLGEAAEPGWPRGPDEEVSERDYHSADGLVHFFFRKPMAEKPEDFFLGFDFFEQLGERHTVLAAVEQDDASHEILFNRFEPDYLYDTGYRPPLLRQLGRFLVLGVEHILIGYDHILFLLALIVVGRFMDLVKIVTSFTVAHSITLILATMEIVRLPSRVVEVGIAVTIVYVAAENLWTKKTGHRWLLTFFFGLVHGFGFASVLRELGLPRTGLMRCLLSFNIGVELGQLCIVAVLWPVAWWMGRHPWGGRAVGGLSVVILLFGLAWLLERTLGWRFMPI